MAQGEAVHRGTSRRGAGYARPDAPIQAVVPPVEPLERMAGRSRAAWWLGLIQVGSQQMADRYAHLPSAGIFVALGWTVGAAARRRAPAVLALATAVPVALGAVSPPQSARWRNSLTLYEHALRVTRDNSVIENNLGNELLRLGRWQEAIPHLETAVRLNPAYADAFLNLGDALSAAGRLEEARRYLIQALSLRPGDAGAHHSLGLVLFKLRRLEESIVHLDAALRLQPDLVEAISNLGNVLYSSGRYDEAAARYQEALRLRPDFADARRNLSVLQQMLRSVGRGVSPAPSAGH